jgi:hypothetical protein
MPSVGYYFLSVIVGALIGFWVYKPKSERQYHADQVRISPVFCAILWVFVCGLYLLDVYGKVWLAIFPAVSTMVVLLTLFSREAILNRKSVVRSIAGIYKEMCAYARGHKVWASSVEMIGNLVESIEPLEKELEGIKERQEKINSLCENVIKKDKDKAPESEEVAIVNRCSNELQDKQERIEELICNIRLKVAAVYATMLASFTKEDVERLEGEVAELLTSVTTELHVVDRTQEDMNTKVPRKGATASSVDPKKHHGAREAAKRTA